MWLTTGTLASDCFLVVWPLTSDDSRIMEYITRKNICLRCKKEEKKKEKKTKAPALGVQKHYKHIYCIAVPTPLEVKRQRSPTFLFSSLSWVQSKLSYSQNVQGITCIHTLWKENERKTWMNGERQGDRETERQIYIDRQTDRQTDRQKERKREIQNSRLYCTRIKIVGRCLFLLSVSFLIYK